MDKCMWNYSQYVAAIKHIVKWIASFKAILSTKYCRTRYKIISWKFCKAGGIKIGWNMSEEQRLLIL
jgi:hypothetical protein